MEEVTRRYYYWAPEIKDSGYYIINQVRGGGYTWEWNEPNEKPVFPNEVYGTISEALEAAAKDWDDNGSSKFLSFRLLQAARAYERQGL